MPVHAMNNVREMTTVILLRNMLLAIYNLCRNVSLSSGLLSLPSTITDIFKSVYTYYYFYSRKE